nr:hypothetical protein [Arthrospira sp. PLM2.Bin9]
MMVKKSLADMVKQEAKKAGSPTPESADTDHSIDTSTSPSDKTLTPGEVETQVDQLQSTLETSESKEPNREPEIESDQSQLIYQRELEAKVASLESNLQQSQETEQVLKREISALQLTVKNAQTNQSQLATKINKLQQQLQQKDKIIAQLEQESAAVADLKDKLEQAELTALHLSETNTKLLQDIEQIKLESSTSQLGQKPTKRSPPHLVPRPEHSLTQPMNNEDFSQSTWLL